MASCEIKKPVVKTKEGNEIPSPLYENLVNIIGSLEARKTYNNIMSDDFKNQPFYFDIVTDKTIQGLNEYGEPTIEALLKYTDFNKLVDNVKYAESVKAELFNDNIEIDSTEKFINALNKINQWNNNHKYYKALLVKEPNGSFDLEIAKNTGRVSLLVSNIDNYIDLISKINSPELFDFYIKNYTVTGSNSSLDYNSLLNKLKSFKSKKSDYNDFVDILKGLPVYKDILGLRISKEIVKHTEFMFDYISKYNLVNVSGEALKTSIETNPKIYSGIIKNHILYLAYKDRLVGDAIIDGLESGKQIQVLVERLNTKLNKSIESITIPADTNNDELEYASDVPKVDINTNYFYKKQKESADTETNILNKLYYFESDLRRRMKRVLTKKEFKDTYNNLKILEKAIDSGNTYIGLVDYIKNSMEFLKELQSKIKKDDPLNIQAKNIKFLMDKCNEYNNIIEYFNDYIKSDKLKKDYEDYLNLLLENNKIEGTLQTLSKEEIDNFINVDDNLRDYKSLFDNYYNNDFKLGELDSFTVTISRFLTDLKKYAVDLTSEFLEQYQTEEGSIVKWGKNKGKKFDIKEALIKTEDNINIYNKLFSAMADCPDQIFRLTDKASKTAKGKARLETQDLVREIKKEALLLEKSGIKDFSWMYDRKADGTKTGDYVTKFNNPDAYNAIMADSRKKRFYEFFMRTKNVLDMAYPENLIQSSEKIIGIRKDRLERFKNIKNLRQAKDEFVEGIKDNYMERSDDEDIAGYSELFTDASGNEFKMLPIYYNNFKSEDADHMSEDAVSTLIAYSAKAIEYKHLNNLIDLIEVEKIVLKERLVPSTDGKLKVINLFNRAFYKEDKSNIEDSKVYHKDGGSSNAYKMFDSWVDMQFYGRFRQREGTIGDTKISTAKMVDMLNKKTATAALSLNLLNGFSNVMTGVSQTRIETLVGSLGTGYVGVKDMAKADIAYSKELMPFISEIGNRTKKSKLALFSEMLNVSQEYESEITNTEWHRNTWAKRFMTSGALGFLQKSGEHYMSHRMAIAIAIHTKLKDSNGKEKSLWDALKVEYIQEDGTYGSIDRNLGARLTLNGSYTLNNKEFKFEGDDLYKLERKITGINQKIHGIYNKQDANLIQLYSWGRLIYMFRKWIPAAIDKRFMNLQYNYDTDDWKEGYYKTTYDFIKQLWRDREGFKLEIITKWKTLDKEQQDNVLRALIESLEFIITLLVGKAMIPDDDSDKQNWARSMLSYQLTRLSSELAALTPVSIPNLDQNMFSETLKLFKSPIAAVNTAQDGYSIMALLNPFCYMEDVKAGKFKGHSKAYKIVMSNKWWNPLGLVVDKNLNPENYIGFYK